MTKKIIKVTYFWLTNNDAGCSDQYNLWLHTCEPVLTSAGNWMTQLSQDGPFQTTSEMDWWAETMNLRL